MQLSPRHVFDERGQEFYIKGVWGLGDGFSPPPGQQGGSKQTTPTCQRNHIDPGGYLEPPPKRSNFSFHRFAPMITGIFGFFWSKKFWAHFGGPSPAVAPPGWVTLATPPPRDRRCARAASLPGDRPAPPPAAMAPPNRKPQRSPSPTHRPPCALRPPPIGCGLRRLRACPPHRQSGITSVGAPFLPEPPPEPDKFTRSDLSRERVKIFEAFFKPKYFPNYLLSTGRLIPPSRWERVQTHPRFPHFIWFHPNGCRAMVAEQWLPNRHPQPAKGDGARQTAGWVIESTFLLKTVGIYICSGKILGGFCFGESYFQWGVMVGKRVPNGHMNNKRE